MFDATRHAEAAHKMQEMLRRKFSAYEGLAATIEQTFARISMGATSTKRDEALERMKQTIIANRPFG